MTAHHENGHASGAHESLTKPTEQGNVSDGGWLSRYPWAAFVVPFAVYMAGNSLEPTADKPFSLLGLSIEYSAYPIVYTIKIALTVLAIVAVSPGYRQFPLRLSPLAPLVGIVGVVAWIGICKLNLEANWLGPLGLDSLIDLGRRPGFNPLEQMADRPPLGYAFLAIRLFGLALVVPLIEEFFIRGFVMRFVIDADWWKVPFGTLTPTAIAAGTLLPVLSHPAELFAAAVWFTLITWLMFKTRNIWDCVVAHAVTNGLLGAWVIATGEWEFM
jgi:CAAX prenyl protease-like protein